MLPGGFPLPINLVKFLEQDAPASSSQTPAILGLMWQMGSSAGGEDSVTGGGKRRSQQTPGPAVPPPCPWEVRTAGSSPS